MEVRNKTEAFLNALKNPYFNNTANVSTEYLRGECRLLSFLNRNKGRKFQSGELAKALDITTPRMATMLKSLEKKGLVSRELCSNDKRKVFVAITAAGEEYIERKRENVCMFFDGIFDKLSEQECDEFIRLISKICEIGEEINRGNL